VTPLLEARGLAIGHGGRVLARGLSLSLAAGEVLCLLGPNGAGKTTLLRTLLGLLRPHAGSVLLDGRGLANLSRRRIARRLAYVPQAASGGFAYTARQAVAMGRAAQLGALAAPGPRDLALAGAALDRLGIARLADRPVTELSGGERQLVLIARALAQEAAALILDEPASALDFGNQVRLLRLLSGLARDGLGVLFTTHQPDHALLIADRVALLGPDGVLHGPGAPDALITAARLAGLYGVRAALGAVGGRLTAVPLLDG
jgi:iron complex transport system ATP-binding protein